MTRKEIILVLILILISLIRFFFFLPVKPAFDDFLNQPVFVEGLIVQPPDLRLKNQLISIKPTNYKSKILVFLPRTIDLSYGDLVQVTGILQSPQNFFSSSGKEFNYKRYLANQDIYFIINQAKIEIISSNHGQKIKSFLFKFRQSFIQKIEKIISSPQSDLANGLLLGTRGGFDEKLRQQFITTGTIHIVALSGYNVTIVAQGIMKFFSFFFSSTFSIFLGILTIFLFVLMTGASVTAVRAGIMAVILLFANLTGRRYQAGRILIIAALLMVSYDLRVLIDLSFQLSFLATAGILFVTPKVLPWFQFFPTIFKLREIVANTTAATISVLPLLLYSTGLLSLISLPANILILPFIPLTMLFSFLTGLFHFLSFNLALPFAFLADFFLSYILLIINFFAQLPFASLSFNFFPLLLTIFLYLFLINWTFKNPALGKT